VKREEPETLLCVANFPANTGYAWDYIERVYARIADHLATHGVRTLVAYPKMVEPPRTLAGSAAEPVVLSAAFTDAAAVRAAEDFIRREGVRALYLTDHPARSRIYLRLRRAGARWILVHDRSSGERNRPRGLKRAAKWFLARLPGATADVVVAVSNYVARRQIEVGLVPASRVVRVWNGISLPPVTDSAAVRTRAFLGVGADRLVVGCACRAAPEKGVHHLLRAFDRATRDERLKDRFSPVLFYAGDGPQMGDLVALRERLEAREDIRLAGYRPDAAALLAGADICVVPSVWQDAFPNAVLETMASGKAVIATSVGGIPDMIEDGVSGLLVPPGDEAALTAAITALASDAARRRALGRAARQRVAARFTLTEQISRLTALIEEGFGAPCGAVTRWDGSLSGGQSAVGMGPSRGPIRATSKAFPRGNEHAGQAHEYARD
jgi:glycosyltransferase involved in cell wall biosynthesis